jgi:hypothetical protein
MALDALFFCFFWSSFGMDGYVIHVDRQPLFSNVVGKYGVHHCLEGGW